jgi:peptidoglycan hydrolase-like protein with peptidoglycan-binding domain
MARDFFRQSAGGASPRGSLISQIQTALDAVPNGPQIRVDGAFGSNTATAVSAFQASNHLQPTGAVTDQVWQKLANSSAPSMFERCLQLTASYEGTGYTHVVGNFDGAGITWGIIGFTLLAGGELGVVIGKINTDFPALVAQAFGANAAKLLHICDPATSVAEKTAFANSVTRDGGVIEPWNTAFQTLGGFPEVQALQTQRAHDIYWAIAVGDGRALSMEEELDLALMFDVAVQNGGLQGNHLLQPIKHAFAAEKPATEQARRLIVTRFVTDASNPASADDVNSRKSCISTGSGTVHRSTYLLADWALLDGMLPPPELADAPVDPDILHWRKLRLAAARARTMRSNDIDS